MDEEIMIELRHITKSFGLYRTNRISVLNDIDLKIMRGEFVCIMGASGSGKSTLLNILSAIDRPTTGSVRIADKGLGNMTSYELAALRATHLGYVFQEFYLIDGLSVYQNISSALLANKHSEEEINEKVNLIAQMLDIASLLNKKVEQCSRGQKQRIAIARALIHQPEIIVADEPTGNLDQANAYQLLKFFQQLHHEQKVTIVLVTHDSNVASYADRLLYLKDGLLQQVIDKGQASREDFLNSIKALIIENE